MKIGNRSKILLSFIDLKILNILNPLNSNHIRNINVMNLSKKLKIKHKNLKPHLDKLEHYGFIKRNPDFRKEKIFLITYKGYRISEAFHTFYT